MAEKFKILARAQTVRIHILAIALGNRHLVGVRAGIRAVFYCRTFLAIWFFARIMAVDVDISGQCGVNTGAVGGGRNPRMGHAMRRAPGHGVHCTDIADNCVLFPGRCHIGQRI